MKQRILLVEDEEGIRKLVEMNLKLEGFEIRSVGNGREALKLFAKEHFDLVLLDLMIPEIDGLKVLEKIKLDKPAQKVIIISAKDSPADRVTGLKKGADDYINKPFNLEELYIRMRKLTGNNSSEAMASNTFNFGKNSIDFGSYTANTEKGQIKLTNKEIKLLKLFVENKNEVIARDAMLKAVWGYDVYPSTRTIDNFVMSLRKYFETDPRKPKYFISIRGVGYKFVS